MLCMTYFLCASLQSSLYQMGVISHLVYKALIHQTLTNQYNGKQKREQENLANGACELQ
jgi:hypothetical protein